MSDLSIKYSAPHENWYINHSLENNPKFLKELNPDYGTYYCKIHDFKFIMFQLNPFVFYKMYYEIIEKNEIQESDWTVIEEVETNNLSLTNIERILESRYTMDEVHNMCMPDLSFLAAQAVFEDEECVPISHPQDYEWVIYGSHSDGRGYISLEKESDDMQEVLYEDSNLMYKIDKWRSENNIEYCEFSSKLYDIIEPN